jgi:hypothetical protein
MRTNVWLWDVGGVYNKLWLCWFVDTPVGVSFVFLVRCSPFACASGVSVWVAVLIVARGLSSPPCCARPLSGAFLGVYVVTGLVGLCEILFGRFLWLTS